MTVIEINKKLYTFPTAWNELSQKQLLEVMECLFLRQYTGEQGCLKLLKILAGLSWWEFFRAKPTQMEEYFYLTKFILEERTELTKQLLPVWDDLHGPCDGLDNIIMQEFYFADTYFMQWSENKEDIKSLNKLVACLYRPGKENYDHEKDPDGDKREAFNVNLCNWRADNIINKWPIKVKLAIAWWYDACRWQIVENNDEVFGGSGDPSKYGMVSMMMSVAEDGVLGDFHEVEKEYVSIVLIKINESIEKAKREEAALKK